MPIPGLWLFAHLGDAAYAPLAARQRVAAQQSDANAVRNAVLLDVAIAYASEREAFGRPIGRFQTIRHRIAEMGVKLEAGRALTYAALRKYAQLSTAWD